MRHRTWVAGLVGIAGAMALFASGTTGPDTAQSPQRREWHVRAGSRGDGSSASPFGRVADALAVAGPGDTVLVGPGTYAEAIATVRGGTAASALAIRASRPDMRPVFEATGRVLTLAHPHVTLDGLVLDGRYGPDDAVRVTSAASGLVLRNLVVRRSGRDCIDLDGPADVLLERVLIHHCLDARGGRKDAHGLVAGPVERLTVRDSEIHTFSGDALQLDPSRAAPGWTDVRLQRVKLWLAPLATAINGFPAGVVPGENGIDTKTPRGGRRASLRLEDVEAWGFRDGMVTNMAAFNIKERVDAVFERVSVHHSQIGFRLRGRADAGATTSIEHAVLHHVTTALRVEDDLASLSLRDVTLGREVGEALRRVDALGTRLDVRRLVVLGTQLPDGVDAAWGRAVGPQAFVDAAADDYRLVSADAAVSAATAATTSRTAGALATSSPSRADGSSANTRVSGRCPVKSSSGATVSWKVYGLPTVSPR